MKTGNSLLALMAILILALPSCAPKIYLQEADKLKSENNITEQNDVRVQSYYSGDALEYLVFELDAFNNSQDTVVLDYRNIQLLIEDEDGNEIVLKSLNKDRLIADLKQYHEEVKIQNRTRNISNAIGIGLNIFLIGNYSNNVGVDLAIYASESAAYMLEDNRAHKLLSGSIEEQIEYVNEWVLETDSIPPGSDNSWDILFARKLTEGKGSVVVKIDDDEYSQTFKLFLREEKLR